MKAAAVLLAASSLAVAGGGGYLIGSGLLDVRDVRSLAASLSDGVARTSAPVRPVGTGPVIYYRHPEGDPVWSLSPSKTSDGRDFLPVRASEDVSFAHAAAPLDATPQAKASQAGEEAKPSAERKVLYYRNPMGLPDTSKTPKKDSMGMDYIPVYEGEADGGSTVKVSLGKLQRTGVKTAEATVERLPQAVRVPGVVMFDDRRIHAVSLRSDSFIEDVADITSGSRVKAGDHLFRFYSKDIATAAAEFTNVVAGGGDTSGSALRLRNLGVSDRMIDEIRKDRKVPAKMTFDAPSDGIVIERTAIPGSMAEPGDVLFRIADTRDVWVVADVPESQLRLVSPGAAASVTIAALPGMPVAGRVELVDPEIREQTRTAKVRVRLPNPDDRLLANMFGEVEISTGVPDPVVTVPNDAIIDTGRRQMVFVDKGEGRFEPRDVTLGSRGTSRSQIRTGLSQGERVVVSANFLLDAESNLNSALNALTAGDAQP
ncbi:cation transporter [Rhizobium sp. Root149]|uniref:efflux RND transporter periplasmic adaptor subunit n=1 Tax=Rhizobium sp. Root149 TaxID=1736473 RepID=UPI000713C488|nr:efflux RND transporter periplasmic adaptor subunit [Rhizobium sp. Root149]KQZ59745.1 cation transporter [Rhizobium sp. Root149]